MIFLEWLFATSFLVYLAFRPSSVIVKVFLSIIVIAFQIGALQLCLIGFMFDNIVGYAMAYFFVLELFACSLYRLKFISRAEKIIGALSFILIGVMAYYYGSVMGPMEYFISDAGGM